MRVWSPKTEHHQGGASRNVPIFAELRPFLDEAWEMADRGAEFLVTRYRKTNANLRTQFERIIGKAGLEPWPKLFHNLRATRQTELEEAFPTHVVCAWLGNSPRVARRNYLQVTEDHFAKAAQNVAQQERETGRNGQQSGLHGCDDEATGNEKTPANAGVCEPLLDSAAESQQAQSGRCRTRINASFPSVLCRWEYNGALRIARLNQRLTCGKFSPRDRIDNSLLVFRVRITEGDRL